MDSALIRFVSTFGFLALGAIYFVLPGTSIFQIALVTGYAHGFQGLYLGFKSGRFKFYTVVLGTLAIFPLSLLPNIILILLAGALATFHFVLDEFHLHEIPPTALSKSIFPALTVLLLGTLCMFFRLTDKSQVLWTTLILLLISITITRRRLQNPKNEEKGILILFFVCFLAVLILNNDRLSSIIHLVGLFHFWSWYIEYFAKTKGHSRHWPYIYQSLAFFSFFSILGIWGWQFNGLSFGSQINFLLQPQLYFSWIIVHCLISIRKTDLRHLGILKAS